MKISILPEVVDDVERAAIWYDENGCPGLGDRFIEAFYAYLPHLSEQGEIHRKIYSDFRKIVLRPFPYFLFYRVHEKTIVITLVIGAMRKPSRIRQHLRSRKAK